MDAARRQRDAGGQPDRFCPAKAQTADGPLGATVDGLLAAGRQLSRALRAAALDTAAAAAKASGAGTLDDPTISNSYQYYKDPGVFSAHTVMLSQSFPLWGKRSLRRPLFTPTPAKVRADNILMQRDPNR